MTYHFDQLVKTYPIWLVCIVKVKEDLGFLLERAFDHYVDRCQERFKVNKPLLPLIKQPEHFITPQPIQMKKRVKMLPYYPRLSRPRCYILKHQLQNLQFVSRVYNMKKTVHRENFCYLDDDLLVFEPVQPIFCFFYWWWALLLNCYSFSFFELYFFRKG